MPTGFFLDWTGQYEILEEIVARMKVVVPVTLTIIVLLLLVAEQALSPFQKLHRSTDRALFYPFRAGRERLADVAPRLSPLDGNVLHLGKVRSDLEIIHKYLI